MRNGSAPSTTIRKLTQQSRTSTGPLQDYVDGLKVYFPRLNEINHASEQEETNAPAALIREWSNPHARIYDFYAVVD